MHHHMHWLQPVSLVLGPMIAEPTEICSRVFPYGFWKLVHEGDVDDIYTIVVAHLGETDLGIPLTPVDGYVGARSGIEACRDSGGE